MVKLRGLDLDFGPAFGPGTEVVVLPGTGTGMIRVPVLAHSSTTHVPGYMYPGGVNIYPIWENPVLAPTPVYSWFLYIAGYMYQSWYPLVRVLLSSTYV
eukprot:SAG11_NODE_9021_length_952_cov_2.218054_1_plen_99_part_00